MRSSSLDEALIALSDPTRRAILDRLSKGEARVTEIAERFPVSLNSISKHIKMLERARLVERQIEGRDHFLRIATEPLDAVSEWIEGKRSFWKAQLLALDEMLRSEDRARRPRQFHKKRTKKRLRATR
jgi:DNA-binding transcriptional ArsR family regulator